MTDIDHLARLERLEEFRESLYRVRDFEHEYEDLDLDSEHPNVPFKYVGSTWDGTDSVLVLADELDELPIFDDGDNAWVPGERVIDLDTGDEYEARVSISFVLRTFRVRWKSTINDTLLSFHRKVTSEQEAVELADQLRAQPDNSHVQVERIADDQPMPPLPELSADARAVIAGLVAPTAEGVNHEGIFTDAWDELQRVFPIEQFRAWETEERHNPDAGL
jgi:hypothetical protein